MKMIFYGPKIYLGVAFVNTEENVRWNLLPELCKT